MKLYKVTIENGAGMIADCYYTELREVNSYGIDMYEGTKFNINSKKGMGCGWLIVKKHVKKIEEIEIDVSPKEKEHTEVNKEERWALCDHCVEAIRSRGEKILSRPMESEDCTGEEYETDTVVCDWCEEECCISDMNICE